MSEEVVVVLMTKQEARACVEDIKASDRNTRALLLDLYERHGWEALGYNSWRACVVGEFKQSERYLYKQLEAAQVEKAICPKGQNQEIGQIPERHLRPLTSLPPDEQREVYQRAVETAPEGKVTAKHVEETVKEVIERKEPTNKNGYIYTKTYPVSDAMAFVTMAITQLERIRPNDPKRKEALLRMIRWAENKILDVPQEPELISPKFQAAFEAMVSAIKNEKGLKWKETSKKDALKCVSILADIITI